MSVAIKAIVLAEWGWKWKAQPPIMLLKMAEYDKSTMLIRKPIRRLPSSDDILRVRMDGLKMISISLNKGRQLP